ncbi:hypothetical protein CIK96_08685 [Prevotella sp. P4-98]|nr:hypothetical protein CIK96_08685 [Prevotella sp. P4-98]
MTYHRQRHITSHTEPSAGVRQGHRRKTLCVYIIHNWKCLLQTKQNIMTSKRKNKQLRRLVTRLMLAMTMVMPTSTWAQEMYTVFNTETKTLTFMYGDKPGSGDVYDVPTDPTDTKTSPGWISDHKADITKVVFDASFKDARPTSCAHWFDNCSNLTSIDNIENLNTSNVTTMNQMFFACKNLISLDLSNFDTSNVTDMYSMFWGCLSLTYLDLSSFNTANVTTMYQMFYDCSHLTSLDLSSFNTANVTTMGSMFNKCSKLTSLDLSSFNTAIVTSMGSMFKDCSSLLTIYVSDVFSTSKVSNSQYMFKNCTSLKGAVPFQKSNTDKSMANFDGYFTKSNLTPYVKWNGDTKVLTFKVANYTEGTNGEYILNEGHNAQGWLSDVFSDCEKVVFTPSFKQAKPTSCYQWFCGFSQLTTIQGIENLNTEEVTDMSNMFSGCSGLTSLNLSNFDTSNVTDMSSMFNGCSGLTSLYLSSFKTAKVKDMRWMFSSCSKLESLDLSNFDTSNVTDMSDMFSGCSGLTSLTLSSFKTAKVTTMSEMFNNCPSLTSLNLSSFNTANVKNMSYMFMGCLKLESLDLSNFDTSNVTDMSNMFRNCKKLTSTSLDLSNFKTANVTNMSDIFRNCSGLTSLDLSSFKTVNVTYMNGMFNGCSGLTTIYVSDDFNTANVSNSDGMFTDCKKLVGAASYSEDKTDKDMANYNTGYFKTYFTLGDSKVELCGNPLTTESLDLTGDYDFSPKYEFKAKSATYSRDLSESESTWFSLCLPFAYTPDNFNFTAYQLKGASADAVEIEEMTGEIAAGTPVLFKFKDGEEKKINISETDAQILKAPVVGTAVNGPEGPLQLCGTYQTKTFSTEDGNAFILLNNKLMNPAKMLDKGVTKVGVKPFRAYMTLTASAGATSAPASARAFSIGRGGEGNEGTTAIDLLNSVATDDAEYYDINGRRINAPAKGVNIVRRGNKTIKLIIK